MRTIDLNADLGEGMGDDVSMLDIVTSANVACGGHAGDVETMFATLSAAAERGVVVGAHPGYVDPEHFGRRIVPMDHDAIGRMVVAQIGALRAVATQVPVEVSYVKLHGALANLAAADTEVAAAVLDALERLDPDLPVLAISGTELDRLARRRGARVFAEVFADRAYRPDGQLVPRSEPGAVLHDAADVTDRIRSFLASGRMPVASGGAIDLDAASICVHGDTPGAVDMAAGLRRSLDGADIAVAAFVAA